jgi:hypothetical protein
MNKKFLFLFSILVIFSLFTFLNGCEKDYVPPPPAKSISFTEEFDTVANLYRKGWVFINKSNPLGTATWQQGSYVNGKFGIEGFPAYSYHSSSDEYIFAGFNTGSNVATISSWMITPTIEMKDGDKFYFFTRTVTGSTYPDRLQVRINTTDSLTNVGNDATAVGSFTTLIVDINSKYASGTTGYPETWKKYEFTISGISTPSKRRIGFRYFVEMGGGNGVNSNAIGIDQFRYESL